MAAIHIPPPCFLRRRWGTNHRSCGEPCDAALLGGWGNDATFALHRLNFPEIPRPRVACKRAAGRWRRAGICSARFEFRGNSAEDATLLTEMAALVDGLFKLNEAVNEAYKGIGADVRNRVDVLYNRATVLQSSADSMVTSGGRVPVHLTATLKALQREHASVENIVRLAMEAGPVIVHVEDPASKLNPFEVTKVVINDEALNTVFKEKEVRNASLYESLTRESSLDTVQSTTSGTEEYLMSTSASEDSSSLSAFRIEIERRVMEQLADKKNPTTDSGVTSKEQEKRLGKGDVALESNNVLGQIQNLPLRGRLPRKREKGAVKDGAQSADTYIDGPEAQPQMLQGVLDQISLTGTQQQSTSIVATDTISKELEELRNALSVLEPQLSVAKEGSVRADRAVTQLQQLTEEMVATVPLELHNQVVKLERESLVAARTKFVQVTAELREKEVIIDAIKQETMAERKRLLEKVRELSGELSRRISAEEVEAAINNAVHELEMELRKALKRAESMRLELEANEDLLKQLQTEWDAERTSLRGELANVKEQLTQLQQEQAGDRAKFMEGVEKVHELEVSVTRLQQSMVEADEERINKEKNVLATVRSLVTDTVKTKRAQAKIHTVDSRLLEAMKTLDGNELESIHSEEKAVALDAFFAMMGVLMQQENGKLETTNHRSRELVKDDHLKQDLGNTGSIKVDLEMMTKPIITLYYESTWEFAYLHYSADNLGWTELPGVCMRNDIVVNNVPLKVIDVEGRSIEFVLTDGRGSWDCAPLGGNYHIKNSGTFLLSSGFIEQKK